MPSASRCATRSLRTGRPIARRGPALRQLARLRAVRSGRLPVPASRGCSTGSTRSTTGRRDRRDRPAGPRRRSAARGCRSSVRPAARDIPFAYWPDNKNAPRAPPAPRIVEGSGPAGGLPEPVLGPARGTGTLVRAHVRPVPRGPPVRARTRRLRPPDHGRPHRRRTLRRRGLRRARERRRRRDRRRPRGRLGARRRRRLRRPARGRVDATHRAPGRPPRDRVRAGRRHRLPHRPRARLRRQRAALRRGRPARRHASPIASTSPSATTSCSPRARRPTSRADVACPTTTRPAPSRCCGNAARRGRKIAFVALANEGTIASPGEVRARLSSLRDAMRQSVARGLEAEGALPGGRERTARPWPPGSTTARPPRRSA